MEYKINPVKATCEKYKNSVGGLKGYNDTCYEVCAAYSGTVDVYDMDPMCAQACEDFITQKKYEIFGVGNCDHQEPARPVIWEKTPNFVPELLKKGYTPEQALQQAYKLCEQSGINAGECRNKAKLHYDAIETYNVAKNNNLGNVFRYSGANSSINFLALIIFIIIVLLLLVFINRRIHT